MKQHLYILRMVLLFCIVWYAGNNAIGQVPEPPTVSINCQGNINLTTEPGICGATANWATPTWLASSPCPTPNSIPGYTLLGVHNHHKYYLSNNTANWSDANNAAVAAGGHLASISDANENVFVSEAAQIVSNHVWIGLTDAAVEGSFQWITGEPFTFSNWGGGEPNNSGNEDFAEIHPDGYWNDLPGGIMLRYVVEFDCSGFAQTSGLESGAVYPVGITTNTFEYNDANGQTAVCSFDVTVADNTPPVIVCPGDMTVHCADQVNYPLPVATDDCGGGGHQYLVNSCAYSSFDMSGATPIGNCDDCLFGPYTLPFSFEYFGSSRSSVYISTNGFVTFDTPPYVGNGCCQGQPLPNANFANSIAVGWTDWVSNVNYKVFGVAPHRIYVVSWSGFEFYTYPQVRMQLALYEGSNEIKIITEQSDAVVSPYHFKTMGLSHDGTIAIPVSGRNSTLWSAFNECISFTPSLPVTLVSGIPSGGAFPPGVTTLTYSASDQSGNTSSCSFNITVVPYMSGTVTVGTGGDYPTLTGTDGLFDTINSSGICGVLTALIISDITEPGTVALNSITYGNPGPASHLLIVPDTEIDRHITGNATQPLIRFNGADQVIIDGSFGYGAKYLWFKNQNTTQPALQLWNGASHNEFVGCVFEGINTNASSGVVVLAGSTGPEGNSFNNFNFNLFSNWQGSATMPANLFYSSGSAAFPNTDNQFYNNEFVNFDQKGICVTATGNGSNWNFDFNQFYFNPSPVSNSNKVFLSFLPGNTSDNNNINNNYFGGTSVYSSGSPLEFTGAGTMKFIVVNSDETDVYSNYMSNLKFSNAGITDVTGIDVLAGYAGVYYNFFGNAGYGSINVSGTGTVIGINSSSTGSVDITQNTIADVNFTKTTGSPVFKGIQLKRGQISRNNIRDIKATQINLTPVFYGIANIGVGLTYPNQIFNNMVAMDAGVSNKPKVYGLFDQSIGIGADFYHNTVNLSGITTIGYSTAAMYRIGNGAVNVYNNILANNRVSNVAAKHYAIMTNSSSFWTSNYNDLYTVSASLGNWAGINYNTLTAWKLMTGKDANSISVAPVFVSPTDLHLVPASNPGIDNTGNSMFSISWDYDGEWRNPSTPDMGADEFGFAPPRIDPENSLTTNSESAANNLSVYPNPFTTSSTITINLTEDNVISIEMYNMIGERIVMVAQGNYTAGTHTFTFDANNLPAGTYLCRYVVNGKESIVKRSELIK